MKQLLLIEDDPIMGESLVQRLELEGFAVTWSRTLAQAKECLQPAPGAIVSDVRLADGLATSWFLGLPEEVRRSTPWFFITGYGSVNDALAAVRAGAREYLTKPFDIERLVALVHASCGRGADEDEPLLGVSPAMRQVEAAVRKVALQRVSVLLSGESGVGKEVAARLIHDLSPRGSGEFVAVNCAAIPENMMEAEFFGYERGAFTGAQRAHRGYLERADGGTLFLDEVAELPANLQAKLLRALQEKSFFRLGSERLTRSDFRVLAASNKDLHVQMEAGAFREDLFYRLAVVRIQLPPLRQRPEDIRWLAERMLRQIAEEQARPLALSDDFLRALMARPWKGNARELRAFLEEAVVLSEAGILDAQFATAEEQAGDSSAGLQALPAFPPLAALIEETERQHIRRALARAGSIGGTAELLGISRKTLWEKMKRLGVAGSGAA